MKSLFSASARQEILQRLATLQNGAMRHWGKMEPAQALAHCTAALEVATGDAPKKQLLIGKLLSPFVRSSVLGEKPFPKNSPTDPGFVVGDARDFEKERDRLVAIVNRACDRGPDGAAGSIHSFFGRLNGDEWGVLMYKHLDHHLRQFGQ